MKWMSAQANQLVAWLDLLGVLEIVQVINMLKRNLISLAIDLTLDFI